MNEVFLSVVCAGAGLKMGANGEECLVRRLYVAGDGIGTWYHIKDRLCLYESVGLGQRRKSGGRCGGQSVS